MPSPVGDSRAWREAGEIGLSAAGMQETVVSYRAHVLSIRVKLQALIYGAGQFVRAGYAVVREKLDDITRGYCGFPRRTTIFNATSVVLAVSIFYGLMPNMLAMGNTLSSGTQVAIF